MSVTQTEIFSNQLTRFFSKLLLSSLQIRNLVDTNLRHLTCRKSLNQPAQNWNLTVTKGGLWLRSFKWHQCRSGDSIQNTIGSDDDTVQSHLLITQAHLPMYPLSGSPLLQAQLPVVPLFVSPLRPMISETTLSIDKMERLGPELWWLKLSLRLLHSIKSDYDHELCILFVNFRPKWKYFIYPKFNITGYGLYHEATLSINYWPHLPYYFSLWISRPLPP